MWRFGINETQRQGKEKTVGVKKKIASPEGADFSRVILGIRKVHFISLLSYQLI